MSKPSLGLLCKIGSIIVHVEEAMSDKQHKFDVVAMQALLRDVEVQSWLVEMRKQGLVPEKR